MVANLVIRLPRARRPRGLVAGALAIACAWSAPVLCSEIDAGKAAKVKAGYLYNFIKFVQWPARAFANASAPVRIAIVGSPQIAGLLKEAVVDESVQGRALEVVPLERLEEDAAAQLSRFHLVFVSQDSRVSQDAAIQSLKEKPVLTVSDGDRFARRGGMIELFLKETRIAMRVNPKAAENSSLEISSKLLRLAEIVESEKKD
ncbi:MAG: hypothetical protein AMXMBFR7_24450 [Planctomycetota bacterium]